MKTFFLIICFVSVNTRLLAQLENAQWRFANYCGLSFTTNPPAFVPSKASSGGGSCSSIADASGQLQFYVAGTDIWNKIDKSMAGPTTPLLGGGTTQGVLIVKQPGNNSLYYIFVAGFTGLRYSIVDMSLAAGMGSVTIKNVLLTTQSQAYKIAGTLHCNKKDVWIVSQDNSANSWRAYLLTASGLSAPVISVTGHTHIVYHAMKFSPDGSKIASTEHGDGVYLYDFDKAVGAVSGMTVVTSQGISWGVEFSPDGKRLYATRHTLSLLQWDLTAGSATAVAASQFTVWTTSFQNYQPNQGALQLAPDGKIYQSYGSVTNYLSVINNPNALGSACNYSLGGLNISPKYTDYGLPNNVKPAQPLPAITYAISQTTCQAVQFTPVTVTVGGITSVSLFNVKWDFGDPGSGSLNSSTLTNPSHVFTAPGNYTVQMIVYHSCSGSDTIMQALTIPNNIPTVSVTGNTMICMGESTTLTASGATNYTWNSSSSNLSGTSVVVNPTVAVTYTVQGKNGVCIGQSLVSVSILPPSVFYLSGTSSICTGEFATLTANGVQNYTWNTSSGALSTVSLVTVNPQSTTTYSVLGYNPQLSCVGQQIITVTVSPYPQLSVSGSTIVCMGDQVSLTASGASTYTWSYPGGVTTGPVFNTQLLGLQSFTLSGGFSGSDCISEDFIWVIAEPCVTITEEKRSYLKAHPNPVINELFIDCGLNFTITIYDLSGRLLFEDQGSEVNNKFDLSYLAGGTYVARIRTADQTQILKIVKSVN